MEIKKCEIDVKLSFICKLNSENYEIIKQENIIDKNDHLIIGIYKTKYFGFIICCNRGNETLYYTKFAATKEGAEILYKDMIEEIKRDLEK